MCMMLSYIVMTVFYKFLPPYQESAVHPPAGYVTNKPFGDWEGQLSIPNFLLK